MRYLPHTDADVARMLDVVGLSSIEALFDKIIPEAVRLRRPLELAPALDEATLRAHLLELAAQSTAPRPVPGGPIAFLGAGVHPHHVPAAVDMLISRGEFYTSYTPYQPELAQGTLQAMFEFQTLVSELTGLEIANASMYDGASACAEAILMARRIGGPARTRTLVTGGVHPEYVEVARTYLAALPGTLVDHDPDATGAPDLARLEQELRDDVACVVVQNPTFHGLVIDVAEVSRRAHARGAMTIVITTDPVAYGALQAPGHAGADIAVGEGVGLALGASLGGPGVGLYAARAAHVRQMPGRLVGETVDTEGRRGYVLTLATREQHIRREKATSNICTNQGLVALAFTIHLALLGKTGLAHLARLIYSRTAYLRDQVKDRLVPAGYALAFPDRPAFSELCLRVPGGDANAVVDRARAHGVIPGVPLGRFADAERDRLLIGVSELNSRADLDRLIAVLLEVAR